MGEFMSGGGPRSRRFDSRSSLTQNLQTSPDVQTHRQQFCASGRNAYNSDDHPALWFGQSAKDGPWHAGAMNDARQFIGSFEMRIKMMTGGWSGYALFVARNKTSTYSGAYHSVGEVNRPGPLQTITQYYWWIEYTKSKQRITRTENSPTRKKVGQARHARLTHYTNFQPGGEINRCQQTLPPPERPVSDALL